MGSEAAEAGPPLLIQTQYSPSTALTPNTARKSRSAEPGEKNKGGRKKVPESKKTEKHISFNSNSNALYLNGFAVQKFKCRAFTGRPVRSNIKHCYDPAFKYVISSIFFD
jgi:hypothetical protein